MAKKRKRRNPAAGATRSNPKRRRRRNTPVRARRRARRNPGFGLPSARGIMGKVVQGVTDALGILGGEGIAGIAEQNLPGITPGTTKSAAAGTVAAVAVGAVASRFVGQQTGRMIVAGAIAKFGRSYIKLQNPNGTIARALGDYMGLPLVTGGTSYQFGGYNPPAGYIPGSGVPAPYAAANGYPY